MSAYRDAILALVYVAITALPIVARALHWQDRELSGVLAPADPIELTHDNLLSGEYQQAFSDAFDSRLGFKNLAITVDNTILYHAFRQTKIGSEVVIGDDRVLFAGGDVRHGYKTPEQLPARTDIEGVVDEIARAQRALGSEHRALVPVLIPAKTWLWRDKVPDEWKLGEAAPPSDAAVYGVVRSALELRGVEYVDAREVFSASKEQREVLWGREAAHWSDYGACLTMREIVSKYAKLTGRPTSALSCRLRLVPNVATRSDNDLWSLLNVAFLPLEAAKVATAEFSSPAPGSKPSVLFVSTSFGWALARNAQASGAFGELLVDYYDKAFTWWPSSEKRRVRAHTSEWRHVVLGRDIYVLDLFEPLVGRSGSHVSTFLDALLAELPEK